MSARCDPSRGRAQWHSLGVAWHARAATSPQSVLVFFRALSLLLERSRFRSLSWSRSFSFTLSFSLSPLSFVFSFSLSFSFALSFSLSPLSFSFSFSFSFSLS
eukprot:CAMPEP_0179340824 /NCGR_PEP_ID=MMETSP0797-20121207/69490_1 /TAXON_ID=47934 /ORGANISM="Dinophysis acuminata, Strain DAEP01" /LENGTH=102 /DNA_ID=CAMNT_0021054819 /DNA_START=263 /DNA_END=567 /DNA_ORIENTATION=+